MSHRSNSFDQTPKDMETAFGLVRVTHLAFLASTLVYGIVAVLLKQFVLGSEPGFIGLDPEIYWLLLGLFALGSIGLGFTVLMILPQRSSPQYLVKQEVMASSAELGQALFKAHTTRMALTEAIAVLGVVLFLLNGNLVHLFAFIGVAFVLLLMIFPRQADWDEAKKLMDKP